MVRVADPDPFRKVALIALEASPAYLADMLDEVIRYAFDQLCWKRTDAELLGLLDELRASVAEEAA